MTTYRQVKGYSVKSVTSDPSNIKEGQLWYNSTELKIKGFLNIGGAWASGNNSNTQSEGPASFGDKTALVAVGGYGPSGPAHSAAVEEYDGTNWTTATAYPSTVYAGQGNGVLTAGIISGGNQSGATFLNISTYYDGTSWTSAPNIVKARQGSASSLGTQTAAIHFGGYDNASPLAGRDETEEFNGTSWSEQSDLSTGRSHGGSAGTQTAAIYFCGETTNTGSFDPRSPNTTEEYDGSSWSNGGTVPARFVRLNGSGIQTACFRIGGSNPSGVSSTTDLYNGTSWASAPSLGSAQNWANSGGGGSTDSIIARGRGASGYTNVTQEFTDPTIATRSIDVS